MRYWGLIRRCTDMVELVDNYLEVVDVQFIDRVYI